MSKERYYEIIGELFQNWRDSKKCYRIRMNTYIEPKFEILSMDEVNIEDFPYVNSHGFYGFEKDGIEEFWIDLSNFKGVYPELVNILRGGFIYKIKTNPEFSEKWGLKIEERELSLEERKRIYEMEYTNDIEVENNHWLESKLKTRNIPTKQITLEYNNEKIETYE